MLCGGLKRYYKMYESRIHLNPSTLKASYNSTTKKVIANSYESGLDNPCFLPNYPQWNSSTVYDKGELVYITSGYIGIYRSNVGNNQNNTPTVPSDYWTKLTNINPCGNTNWYWKGYGGIGRTPKVLTVRFSVSDTKAIYESLWKNPPYTSSYNIPNNPGPGGLYRVAQVSYNRWECTSNNHFGPWWHCVVLIGCGNVRVTLHGYKYPVWVEGKHYSVGKRVMASDGDSAQECIKSHTATQANRNSSEFWAGILHGNDDLQNHGFFFYGDTAAAEASPYDDRRVALDAPVGYYGYDHYYGDWYVKTADNKDAWSKLSGPPTSIAVDGCSYHKPIQGAILTSNGSPVAELPQGRTAGFAYISPGSSALPYSLWGVGQVYDTTNAVLHDNAYYYCLEAHTAALDNEPGKGEFWQTYWALRTGC